MVAYGERIDTFGVECNKDGATLVFLDQTDTRKSGSSEELAENLLAVVYVSPRVLLSD
jgi:hypothetical protein